jgi:hopanoid-associated phosphorylase
MGADVVIAVTGLKREAAMLKGPGVRAIAGGGDRARLGALLEEACAEARGVISIGLGGALAPGLKPGDWVVADAVIAEGERLATDPAWTARLVGGLPGARAGAIAGSATPVADAAAKAALHASTGALAVDMESHIAARAAARHGLSFAAARTISDAAGRALPAAALAGMRSDGAMDVGAVLAALARRPWELPALILTAMEAEAAFRALLRGRELLGGALVGPGPDLGELVLDVG